MRPYRAKFYQQLEILSYTSESKYIWNTYGTYECMPDKA